MMDLYVVQVLQPTLHTDVGSFMKPIKENPDIFFLPLLIKKGENAREYQFTIALRKILHIVIYKIENRTSNRIIAK